MTFDIDFSNVVRYPPDNTPGILVLREHNNLFAVMRVLVETLLAAMRGDSPRNRLWIVEPGRIRIHENE